MNSFGLSFDSTHKITYAILYRSEKKSILAFMKLLSCLDQPTRQDKSLSNLQKMNAFAACMSHILQI